MPKFGMPQAKPNMNGMQGVDMAPEPVFSATVWRWMGERQVTSRYAGYPIVEAVTVKREMVLTAHTQDQLDFMVHMASVDGWRLNGES